MPQFTNIAAYCFTPLVELKAWRERLLALCQKADLRGTILLSEEGINLFVAGEEGSINLLLAEIRSVAGLKDLTPKISLSDRQPFSRMLVRIKKEIIAFGVAGIDPSRRASPKVSPAELKQWLDEGRPLTLLDTRNNYEVRLGTFQNALSLGLDHFRDFPTALTRLPDLSKELPVVTFCTGGIRCEKAAPYLESQGFKKVFQLDGGILKYFEECGSTHYKGECFVFDQRVGVDPALMETNSIQCFNCQSPLAEAEQQDPRFVAGKSCPYCHETNEQRMAILLEKRHVTMRNLCSPLPGSIPYDNFRPITVPQRCHGATLSQFLKAVLPHVEASLWINLIAQNLLLDRERRPISDLTRVMMEGERVYRKLPLATEPEVNPDIKILHEDEALIVIDKPAPLPVHPGGRYHRNTLEHLLHAVYHPQKPRAAHRLDANTTGVLLLTRTRHFAARLQPQFERGEVRKTYLARVRGNVNSESFVCEAPLSRHPHELGARKINQPNGLNARTEVQVIERFADGTTLLKAIPITGRTNQIRAHLWALGMPICGDAAYLPEHAMGETQTLPVSAPPLCLHSWKIDFRHPLDSRPFAMEAALPSWVKR